MAASTPHSDTSDDHADRTVDFKSESTCGNSSGGIVGQEDGSGQATGQVKSLLFAAVQGKGVDQRSKSRIRSGLFSGCVKGGAFVFEGMGSMPANLLTDRLRHPDCREVLEEIYAVQLVEMNQRTGIADGFRGRFSHSRGAPTRRPDE